ncbi:MAG TPA: hypothetical protein VFS67_01625, partial [Polyangiaceae bacterium]|nr:hypothetical protein [Polyangiaceae bacterium]
MKATTTIAVACVAMLSACGSDDGSQDSESNDSFGNGGSFIATAATGDSGRGGQSPSSGSTSPNQSSPQPQCRSIPLANGTAFEKVNAAVCFGLPDPVACETSPAGDFTHCETSVYWYEVDWYQRGSVTYGDIYGAEFPDMNGPIVATVYQGQDGSFRYEDTGGVERMYCTVVGDVA